MSESAKYRSRINTKRYRQLRLARMREDTHRSLSQYTTMYEEMIREGLYDFVPEELDRVKESIEAIRRTLKKSPEQANRDCMELGMFMSEIRSLANAAKYEMEARHRARMAEMKENREKASVEITTFFNNKLQEIKDPVVRDFAFSGLESLRKELSENGSMPSDITAVKDDIQKRFSIIHKRAEKEAEAWKQNKRTELKSESNMVLLNMHAERMETEKKENPQVIEKLLSQIEETKKQIQDGINIDESDFFDKIQELASQKEAAVMDERIRKEIIKGIIGSLKSSGFVLVENPKRIKDNDKGKDEVVVYAKRPAGNRAEFRVQLTGDFYYCFDQYDGQACKKDIKDINAKLKEIYGIQLSDKRVIWENPDRLDRSATSTQSVLTREI